MLVALLAVLVTAAPALAGGGTNEMPGQPANALALQALALLELGRGHEAAVAKLDQALAAGDKGGVNVRILRAAHEALHRDAAAEAARLLRDAFPPGSSHVVGVTYRPRIETARVAAGVAGAIALAAAAAALLRRSRLDRRRTA